MTQSHALSPRFAAIESRLLPIAQWSVWLIPLACAVSRFAADMLLCIAAVTFLIHAVMVCRTDWLRVRWVQVALLLWVYVMVLGLFAPNMETALGRAAAWVRFPIFAMALVFWVLEAAKARERLMLSLSIAVGFMLVDTAIQYFVGYDVLGYQPIPSEGAPRLTGPFSAPRVGIMLVWMAIPVIAYWLMAPGGATRQGKKLWLGAAYAVGILTVIFMSGERMALLLTGLGFVLAFFMLPISKRLMLGIAVVGMLLMGALAYTNPGLVVRQFGSTTEVVDDVSGSVYGMIWDSALNVWEDNPVFGVGLRQFREVCPDAKYGTTDPKIVALRCNLHPHNMYLEWLVESGVVGFGLFLLLLALIVREIVHSYPALRTDPAFLGLIITLVIRLWPLASTTGFFTAWSAVPYWLVVGWLLALCHHHDKRIGL
jgi:O-antigen ligase